MDEVEKLKIEIEIWVSKHSQPFYKKGPLGETDTIKSDEFCPALARFILKREIEAKLEVLNTWKRSNKSGAIYSYLRSEIRSQEKKLSELRSQLKGLVE